MVIMALDHVRDFFFKADVSRGGASVAMDPTNLATTTPGLFFTRWITHFCAPIFLFLAGTSVFLMGQKKTKSELSIFLITRGFWLVLVELFIITLAWTYNPFYNLFILQVIWAIGISMILFGLVIQLVEDAGVIALEFGVGGAVGGPGGVEGGVAALDVGPESFGTEECGCGGGLGAGGLPGFGEFVAHGPE